MHRLLKDLLNPSLTLIGFSLPVIIDNQDLEVWSIKKYAYLIDGLTFVGAMLSYTGNALHDAGI